MLLKIECWRPDEWFQAIIIHKRVADNQNLNSFKTLIYRMLVNRGGQLTKNQKETDHFWWIFVIYQYNDQNPHNW